MGPASSSAALDPCVPGGVWMSVLASCSKQGGGSGAKPLHECWCRKGIPPALWAVLGEPPCSFRAVLVLALTSVASLGCLLFCSHTGTVNLNHLVPYIHIPRCVAALPWVTLGRDRKGKRGVCSSREAVQVTLGWGSENLARAVHLCLTLEAELQSELFLLWD